MDFLSMLHRNNHMHSNIWPLLFLSTRRIAHHGSINRHFPLLISSDMGKGNTSKIVEFINDVRI